MMAISFRKISTVSHGFVRGEGSGSRASIPVLLCLIWFGLTGALVYLSSARAEPSAQLFIGGSLLVALYILKRFNSERRVPHLLFLAIAAFIVLRYLFWRVIYTIQFTDWLSFTCALILFTAELYGMVVFFIGCFINASPITRDPAPLPPLSELPTVDVLIPSYNESPVILEATLLAALQMRYPKDKRNVYLCDDGGTDQKCNSGAAEAQNEARERRKKLTELCETLGARYLTRPKNQAAKAGNLTEAFQRTEGELVAIFDADHMPTEDFLEKTVGMFALDPKLFLVQTPHFFINPDPIEKNLDTFYRMPSENEMFYQVIQKGLDFWNASFFCGSGAVLRRAHLEITGGLSGETITEDAETALTLHSKGLNSAYISTPMLCGFAPETMGAFIQQRVRWAQGMVQILLFKCPLFIRGLSPAQRLCYFNSCFFWFFPFARIVYLVAPIAFLVFGLKIFATTWQTFVAYVIPYIVTVFGVSNYLYGKVRWAFISELYELLQSVYTIPAIFSTILHPRAPTFKVTPKGETLSRDFISPLAVPFYVLALINIGTVLVGIWRLWQVRAADDAYPIGIALFWGLVNCVLLLATLGALLERRQRRATPRMPASVAASLLTGEYELPCQIADLSLGGCKMVFRDLTESVVTRQPRAQLRVEIGDERVEQSFNIRLRTIRTVRATGEIVVGAEFAHANLTEVRAKIRLVIGNRQRWIDFQKKRESKLGVLGAFLSFTGLGVKSSLLHLAHLVSHAGDSVGDQTRVIEAESIQSR
jgi:cellulose synthase (UDP-forming)